MALAPKQLIVLGDSSVYGWGDPIGGGWCSRLKQQWMSTEGSPVIYPLGIRGDGLEKVAKRWKNEWECRGELRRNLPNGLLLAIGLNDTANIGREDGRPQLTADAFRFGLKRLLTEMNKQTNVLVMGLTPVDEKKMPFADCLWYTNNSCDAYEREIEKSCLDLNIPFLPIFKAMRNETSWEQFLTKDGIHLNSKGHEWIYSKVSKWPPLTQWIEKTNQT